MLLGMTLSDHLAVFMEQRFKSGLHTRTGVTGDPPRVQYSLDISSNLLAECVGIVERMLDAFLNPSESNHM